MTKKTKVKATKPKQAEAKLIPKTQHTVILTNKKLKRVLGSPPAIVKTTAKTVHHHLVKRPHHYLMKKSKWYERWHLHVHVGVAIMGTLIIAGTLLRLTSPAFALSSWVQNDWSGGVGLSTTNQYSSASNANTASTGHLTLSQTSNWYNSSWKYREKITFNNTTANLGTTSENLTNFPVLVKLSSSNFDFTKAQSAGQDIRFTDSDGTTALSYEIEAWSNISQTATIWVKVPQVDSNSSTDNIYIYYGNGSASDGQTASSVWSGYAGVWHLNDPTNPTDSTGNGNNGTNHGATLGIGQIAGGASLNNQYVSTTNITQLDGASTFTFSAWVKRASVGSIVDFGKGSGTNYDSFEFWSDGQAYFETGNGNQAWGTFSSNDTSWHFIQMVFDGTQTGNSGRLKAYMDGVQRTLAYSNTIAATTTSSDSSNFDIGRYFNATASTGSLDEVRVSSVARDAAYIAADYKNETGNYSTFAAQEYLYTTPATLTSNILDTSVAQDWHNLTYTASTPTGTSVVVKVRAGNQPDLSDASAFSSCSGISSGNSITSSCAPNKSRYVQYQVTLSTTDATVTPDLQTLSIAYSPSDNVPPPTNASSLAMFRSNGGASVASNGWTNINPYFTWTAGADDGSGSGVKGYCLYLGQDNTADPTTTKGLLGSSPVDTGGTCQFAVSGNGVDLSTAGYITTALTSSNSPYYLLVKVIDNADNVYTGSAAQFHFRFDNTQPTNPAFITAPSQFVSSKAVTLTWDTSGISSPADGNSGLAGLQYRIGSSGSWYGDNHNGAQDSSDLLANDGSYTMQSSPDFANLAEGNNIVYFRTWDAAGNTSTANVTTVIKLNTASPSSPQNVTPTPGTNTTNSFAFSWLAPASFTGSAANITYCYSVNAAPTSNNCTFTAAGVTSLDAGAYATQPGDNTFYVVAKDEAGNINYATAATTTFTANTPAPGIPLNMEIADVSTKGTSSWKLALSWNAPTDIGAGVANYKVFRSTDNSNFTQVSTTAGTSVVDTGLSQVTYYYKVKACDSANNCGAFSDTVSKLPTGRFTSPANLVADPSVSNLSTRKATISWVTDRASDSRIQFGAASGVYQATEAASSDQVTQHSIDLTNLNAGTTYYYVAKWTDTDGNVGASGEQTFTTLPAPSISNVSVSGVNLSDATIQFTSKDAVQVKIYYGKSAGFGGLKTINTSASASDYTIDLAGLDDGTQYFYKLNTVDGDGNEYDSGRTDSFTTPARPRISNLRFQPVADQPTSTQEITWDTNVPSSSEVDYGPSGEAPLTSADATLATSHQMTISGLIDNKEYSLTAQSRDSAGNLAVSDKQIFHTALDTRPPKISAVKVSSSIKGTGSEAGGQIIVSWKTDEPASSQVAYGVGSGSTYANSTSEDDTLVLDHVVIVSNLPTSQIFHLQALSKDASNNLARSQNYSAIVGDASDNVLSIVFNALQKVFGF